MIEIIITLALAILLLGIAGALGNLLFQCFNAAATPEEKSLFSIVLGSGMLGILLFFIGIFHLYYSSVFIFLLAVALFLFYKKICITFVNLITIIKEIFTFHGSKIIKICKMILIVFFLLNFLFTFTPEVQWDSLVYHLTVPKIYAQQHGIVEIPYDYHSYFPKQTEIFYVIGESFDLQFFPKIFMFFFNFLLICGVYVFCKNTWNQEIGIIASTIVYTIPIMVIYQPTSYNDIAMTLFLFYACIAFLKAVDKTKHNQNWIYFCGFLVGCASATKIISLSMLAFFTGAYFCYTHSLKMKMRILNILILVLMCFLVISPWLTLTYIQTKNPVYPFFYNFLGGEDWTPEIEEFWSDSRVNYGYGRTIQSFLMSPWNVTMHPMHYGPVYGYTPLFLIFIPLFFILQLYKKEKECLFFLLFTGFYSIIWFLLASDGRYIFPILPLCTIITSLIIFHIWKKQNIIFRYVIPLLLILILISNTVLLIVINRNAFQFLAGIQTKEDYIQHYLQNYKMTQWINTHLEDNIYIFVANDDRTYFLDKPYFGGYAIIQGDINYVEITTPEDLKHILKQRGVTHIMLTEHITSEGITLTPFSYKYNDHVVYLLTGLVDNYCTLIIEKNQVFLYALNTPLPK